MVIFGAGGHGRVCAEVALDMGFDVVGFIDAKEGGGVVNGIPIVCQSMTDLPSHYTAGFVSVFVAIGNNATRLDVWRQARLLGYQTPSIRHSNALVSRTANVGLGTVLMAGVIVNANTTIGNCCILNTGCSVDHDNVLDEGVQLSPGVRSAGSVHFGRSSFVGTGAVLIPGVSVGAQAVVGAGAVVIRDVVPGSRVAGNPARSLRR